ncbi:hypothetical protein NL108_017647 [Boleophthalmus pectinirostris]|nr:transmembrane protein 176A-like isoform X2 [Boleophthalmus pectinirostris]KAJ0069085.1 hypothetical protein NL108_017647 [Boleophthalmus pectinirostris]
MAMSLKRTEGVTVITLTSDPSSTCPPVCQLLGSLCYTPALCSRSRRVAIPGRGSLAVLGSLWIMAGVMQAALGSILLFTRVSTSYMLRDMYCPLWLGALFVGVGVSNILTEKYPRPSVLLFNFIFNLAGAVMSVFAIIWYSSQFNNYGFSYMLPCVKQNNDYYWYGRQTTTPNPQEDAAVQRCLEVLEVLLSVVFGVSVLLVAVTALGLCLWLSSTILSIKALRSPRDKSESTDLSTPLLEDDGTASSQYDKE